MVGGVVGYEEGKVYDAAYEKSETLKHDLLFSSESKRAGNVA